MAVICPEQNHSTLHYSWLELFFAVRMYTCVHYMHRCICPCCKSVPIYVVIDDCYLSSRPALPASVVPA